jgi:iron(II)-dependent oxidoreductase
MDSASKILERHRLLSASFGSEPLLVHPDGRVIDLATGYIPLLSTFTTEDKAAKGLRKGKETFTPPVYFSLLELLRGSVAKWTKRQWQNDICEALVFLQC